MDENVTGYEKMAVILVFGILAFYSMYRGNYEASASNASTIAVYFLSRSGA